MMEQVLGPLPDHLIQRTNKLAAKYFVKNKLCWPDGAPSRKSVKAVKKLANIRRVVLEHGDSSAVPYLDTLVDLLGGMLRYDPEDRMTAQQALNHPFFQLKLAPSIPSAIPSPSLLVPGQMTTSGFDTQRVVYAAPAERCMASSQAVTPSVVHSGMPAMVAAVITGW